MELKKQADLTQLLGESWRFYPNYPPYMGYQGDDPPIYRGITNLHFPDSDSWNVWHNIDVEGENGLKHSE